MQVLLKIAIIKMPVVVDLRIETFRSLIRLSAAAPVEVQVMILIHWCPIQSIDAYLLGGLNKACLSLFEVHDIPDGSQVLKTNVSRQDTQ